VTPDPKPAKRIVDKKAVSSFAKGMVYFGCQACLSQGWGMMSVHHLVPRSQGGDDIPENLAMLCGSGTSGCHGNIHNHDSRALQLLGENLTDEQKDYIIKKKGEEWLINRFAALPTAVARSDEAV